MSLSEGLKNNNLPDEVNSSDNLLTMEPKDIIQFLINQGNVLEEQKLYNNRIEQLPTMINNFNQNLLFLSSNPVGYAKQIMPQYFIESDIYETSAIPVSHAAEYNKYILQHEEKDLDKIYENIDQVIKLLKTSPIPNHPSPEKSIYMDEFKTFYDEIEKHPSFKGKKTYMFDSLPFSFRSILESESEDYKEIIIKIVKSTYFNKDRILEHLKKNLEMVIEIKDMKLSYKNMSEERHKYRLNLIHAIGNGINVDISFIDENGNISNKHNITKLILEADNIIVSYMDNNKNVTTTIPLLSTGKDNIMIFIK